MSIGDRRALIAGMGKGVKCRDARGLGESIIIRSSDEVPSVTLLERFPLPKNFGVPTGSRIERGRSWPARAGALRVKTLEICRPPDWLPDVWATMRERGLKHIPVLDDASRPLGVL